MKFTHRLKTVLASLVVATVTAQSAYSAVKVVGYFPDWTSYSVSSVQYSKLTHINYAFVLPTSTGGLTAVGNPSKLQSLAAR